METNVVITKEYLDKIRKFTAIRPDETFIYTPIAFRELPENMRPRFTLRPISGEDALRYSDSMRGEVTVQDGGGKAQVSVKRGEYVINVVHGGLLSWENYYDSDGKIIPYSINVFSHSLPMALMEELCDIITGRSSLSSEEVLGLK